MNLLRSFALLLASAVVANPALAQDRRVPSSGAELRCDSVICPLAQRAALQLARNSLLEAHGCFISQGDPLED